MRMLKKLFVLIVVFGVLLAKETYSQDAANYSNDVVPLRLKAGMITEAEFPTNIANVTKSVSSDFLQIETLGNRMFLLPRENFDSQVYVITQDNVSYCLHLIMDEAQAPSRIKIKKPSEAKVEPQNKEIVNTIELMKTLINGESLQGAVASKLQLKEIFNNGKFRIIVDEVYELQGNTKAFVLTFENLTYKPIVVPIEHIELPGLLAVSVDSQILEARHRDTNKKPRGFTTKAYMIVEGLNQ